MKPIIGIFKYRKASLLSYCHGKSSTVFIIMVNYACPIIEKYLTNR